MGDAPKENITGEKPPTSYLDTFLHHFKIAVGSGILSMGYAFKQAGMLIALPTLILAGIISIHTQQQLIKVSLKAAEKIGGVLRPDYFEAVHMCMTAGSERFRHCARGWALWANIFLVVSNIGFSCVYIQYIAESIWRFILEYGGVDHNIRLIIMYTFLPIWLLTNLGSLKMLAPFALIANICSLSGIFASLYLIISHKPPKITYENFGNFNNMPQFFGIAATAYSVITSILFLYKEMAKPEQFTSPCGVINVATTVEIALTVIYGTIAYYKYGQSIKGNVTLNFEEKNVLASITIVCIAVSLLCSCVLMLYFTDEILYPLIYKKFGPFDNHPVIAHVSFRTLVMVIVYTICQLVPYFANIVSLTGCIGSSALIYLYPPLLELDVCYDELNFLEVIKDIFIILFGIVGMITGVYSNIYNLVLQYERELG